MVIEPGGTRDEAWFEALFRSHGNQVAAYVRRRVPSETDDAVSEVFAATWRHREKVPDPPLAWLYRTASDMVLHSRQGRARKAALTERIAAHDEPDRDAPDPWSGVGARIDDRRTVERLFSVLPPRDVEILRVWAWEQLDAHEIAYVLTISPPPRGCVCTVPAGTPRPRSRSRYVRPPRARSRSTDDHQPARHPRRRRSGAAPQLRRRRARAEGPRDPRRGRRTEDDRRRHGGRWAGRIAVVPAFRRTDDPRSPTGVGVARRRGGRDHSIRPARMRRSGLADHQRRVLVG